MRTQQNDIVASALFSNSLQQILCVLYSNPEKSVHLRGIVRESGQSPGTTQRTLNRLSEAGIVARERQGNQVFYRANPACPIYSELIGITTKTIGIANRIKRELSNIEDKIQFAFIFGSFARGENRSESDVDLFLLGDVKLAEVSSLLRNIQEKLNREINPVVYTRADFIRQYREESPFLRTTFDEPKIFIIGDLDEFTGLVDQVRTIV